jgi:Uma2 family endonuclease
MGATTLIPVEEYLKTSYSPDCEYVDGVVLERNVGEKRHSRLQSLVIVALVKKYPSLYVWPEWRMKTVGDRHRIPDVCVTLAEPDTDVLQEAPFIAIEILSPDDSMSRVIEKLEEYSAIGTPNIWLFDPRLRQMFTYRAGVLQLVEGDLIGTENPRIELTRDEVFPV